LYRLGADLRPARILTGVTISNGLGWSPDHRTMYYIDSATYGIDAFDVDVETGDVANRRRQMELPRDWGLPDGMTVDAEGLLWVAFWGGFAVRRLAPDGRVASLVRFRVTHVTSCAFGGDDLGDLYVTSARGETTETSSDRRTHAGGLFRLRPGVQGVPESPFGESAP
jgi:sugar lactone lactonase YvrE